MMYLPQGEMMYLPQGEMSDFNTASAAALISPCGRFRYRLRRLWDASLPVMYFIMLNPSTADGSQDDPTIRRCVGFAKQYGFGAIEVLNLFAYRATDPRDLKAAGYPVGEANDSYLWLMGMELIVRGGIVVCAWGANAPPARASKVIEALRANGVVLHALGQTKHGAPKHPLYLPYTCKPVPLV